MNKETEMYIVKRFEEMARDIATARFERQKLIEDINLHYKPSLKTKEKADAFDVISKFIVIQCNPIKQKNTLTFTTPEIDINQEMFEMFWGLLNG